MWTYRVEGEPERGDRLLDGVAQPRRVETVHAYRCPPVGSELPASGRWLVRSDHVHRARVLGKHAVELVEQWPEVRAGDVVAARTAIVTQCPAVAAELPEAMDRSGQGTLEVSTQRPARSAPR